MAVPVFRVACKVGIDKGRGWSVVEELILWSMTRQSKSIAEISQETKLPHQIVVAAIARLMRFRLVEVAIQPSMIAFRASDFGFMAISSGNPLPYYPTRITKRANFVIEWISGDFFHTRDISLMSLTKLEQERKAGAEIRTVAVDGGGPSMSHEANLRRLSALVAGGWNEEVALVDGRTASLRDDEFMVIRVIDGNPRGVPEHAGPTLRKVIQEAANMPAGTGEISVTYAGPPEDSSDDQVIRECDFDPADLIIGGSQQRDCFVSLLEQANSRVIIHSTFLDSKRFVVLVDALRIACDRGVTFDLLWGAESDDDTDRRNSNAAIEIAEIIRKDPTLNSKVRMHLTTTGSHAKLILLDTRDGWATAIGSCNWLSSPFQAVELSVVLRDHQVVADVAIAIQRMVGRRGLSDNIANEMALVVRDLRRSVRSSGSSAKVSILIGEAHDRVIRTASGVASKRFFVGSNRLGSTARPGAILQGEVAASREGVDVIVLYTQSSGPLKNRHARALAEEAATNGVRLVKTRKLPLHGKLISWDDDNVVVTSLNWASSSANVDFPWADVGVHIDAPTIGKTVFDKLQSIFPELSEAERP